MNRCWRLALLWLDVLLVAGAAIGCATTTVNGPYDPFQVPRDEVRRDVRVVAVMPIRVSRSVFDPEEARARFEPAIIERLEAGGLKVLDSSVWDRLWLEIGTDVGAIYDTSTGEIDEDRFNIVRNAVYQSLESDYDVDAILDLSISTVDVHSAWAKEVSFCGGEGEIYWPGGWQGSFIDRTTLVRATCLNVFVVDLDRRELYSIHAPLEVVETYARQTRAVRPEEERFLDEVRIKESIANVIGPMADNSLVGDEAR